MPHWRIDDIQWDRFDAASVPADVVPLVKAASLVEWNGRDYAAYLCRVFADDSAFRTAAEAWAEEEVQHGAVLGRWAGLADPSWDFAAASARFKAGYRPPIDGDSSIRGSRTGELIARCMVETGTSSYYTALADACAEPVLKQICRRIAADEFRHYKLFYDHMRRYQDRERIGGMRRALIAIGRVRESEDDELAFAFHCANEPADRAYDRERCNTAYLNGAMRFYRPTHVRRGVGMTFKAMGFPATGRMPEATARLAWWWMNRKMPDRPVKSSATAAA